MPHYQLNLKFRAKKENLPAKRIQVETMSASLVFQISYHGSIMKGLSLSVPVPTLTLYTDASNLGWGAYLEGS
jgi:hypothetical protein